MQQLVAYWELREPSGVRHDAMGVSHLVNVSVASRGGALGSAAFFDPTSSAYLSIPDSATLSLGDIDFTVAAWFNLKVKAIQTNAICSKDKESGSREFHLLYNTAGGFDRAQFSVFRASDTEVSLYSAALDIEKWHFAVGTHNAATDTMTFQINGGSVSSGSVGGSLQASGSAEFRIGALNYTGFPFYWTGMVGPVGLWKRCLTLSESMWLFNAGRGRSFAEF